MNDDVLVLVTRFALCGEVAKLKIQRRTPDNIVELRAAVARRDRRLLRGSVDSGLRQYPVDS